MTHPPLAFSHVGVTVPDIEAATRWYIEHLGYYLLVGPIEVREDDTPLGLAASRIYGKGFSRFRFTHLAAADGSGLELFQFDNPKSERPDDNFEYWKGGINHFALTSPDVQALVDVIVEAGGRQRGEVLTIDAERGFQIVYCEDPWGTVLEVCSHLYPHMWGA